MAVHHMKKTNSPRLPLITMTKGGITCNSCGTVPIRGLRYKCANCQDYDLCEGCEAAEVHIKSHVFMKIRIPIPPLANSRTKKLPPFYPGVPKGNTTIPEHVLQELLQKTHCRHLSPSGTNDRSCEFSEGMAYSVFFYCLHYCVPF